MMQRETVKTSRLWETAARPPGGRRANNHSRRQDTVKNILLFNQGVALFKLFFIIIMEKKL